MPVSVEQWRASVGLNNAARSRVLSKLSGKQPPKDCLSQFVLFLLTLVARGVGFSIDGGSCDVYVANYCLQTSSRGHTHGHTHTRACWQLLCVVFSIVVISYLLQRSGDIETNPGPLNLVLREVRRLIHDTCTKWFHLGLELGLSYTELNIIRQNFHNDVEDCFTEMLEKWLRMADPPPTWEGLIEALKQPSVAYPVIAEQVQQKLAHSTASRNSANGTIVSPPVSAPPRPRQQDSGVASGSSAIVFIDQPIEKQIKILEKDFKKISTETYAKIEEMKMSVGCLKVELNSLPIEYKEEHKEFFQKRKEELDRCSTVDAVWTRFSMYWNYLNYTQLESFIDSLDDPSLSQKMSTYVQLLQSFQSRTRVCDFARHCPNKEKVDEEDLKDFVLNLKLNWKTCTLENVNQIAGHIMRKFHLDDFVAILKSFSHGSVSITWSLPAIMALRVRNDIENTDMSSFYKEHGILSISIDGEECKYSAVKHYSAYLKDLYSHKEGKNLAPFKLARIFTNLKNEEMVNQIVKKFTRSTLRGDQDDVMCSSKHHMEEDQVCCPTYWTDKKQPRLVLIEGAPGVGKTTFSEQFCYKWSQGQRLSNHKLLILLPLRDKSVRSAKNVSDLFQHPQLQQAIAEEVERSGGEGVALWLEAWDELEKEMREKSSLFLELVHGRVLPKATVLITSRPWATENIRKSASMDQHVEIVSTPTIQFRRVLREERVKPDSRAKLLDYVDFNPSMKAAMHTPVTANIVADVFQWSRDTESPPPTTVTQLYTALTCKLLMQHLSSQKAEGKQSRKIRSLEEVPDHIRKQLMNLCRLSWEGLVGQQLTFSSDAVGGDTLGLMHGVRELYGGEDSQLSYHFIHLTLQEFLSAYHITQLPPNSQEQVIQEHVSTGHLTMAVRFYFELTKPNTFTSSLVSEHITSQQNDCSADVFHWLYETDHVGKLTEIMGSDKEMEVYSSYSWNLLDYYALGRSISQYNFRWNLNFLYVSMGDDEMEMLCKGIATGARESWKGEITKADFSSNSITTAGVKSLEKIPQQVLQRVKALHLGANKLDKNTQSAISGVLCELSSLQNFSIPGNSIGEGGAVEIFNCLQNSALKELDIRGTGVGEEDIESLIQLLRNNLDTLHIDCVLLPSIMKQHLPNCKLETLDMSRSFLPKDATQSLVSLLQQSDLQLKELNISNCNVSSEEVVELARAVTDNHWLSVLDMSYNKIESSGATALGEMIGRNTALREIWLRSCGIATEACEQLVSGLAENSTLRVLVMEDNSVGMQGAKALGKMLIHNTALTELHITRCGITAEGCKQLAAGLGENSTLHVLKMAGNSVGVEGAEALGKMLVHNKSLESLYLNGDNTLEEGVDSIISSLHTNKTLTCLTLSRKYQQPSRSDQRIKWQGFME